MPRGRVRPRDLQRLRLDIGLDIDDAFLESPRIDVRCGQALLATLLIPGEGWVAELTVPRALRERLKGVRGRVTWGATSAQGPQARAGIWIDPPSAEERRALQELHTALEGEPGWIHDILEAQLLLDQEFDQAALAAAKALLARRPREPHAAAILQAAYTLLGLQDLPEANEHEEVVARPLHEARGKVEHRCHLDREAPRLRSRERRPLGGC
jgi:hypothetical protein